MLLMLSPTFYCRKRYKTFSISIHYYYRDGGGGIQTKMAKTNIHKKGCHAQNNFPMRASIVSTLRIGMTSWQLLCKPRSLQVDFMATPIFHNFCKSPSHHLTIGFGNKVLIDNYSKFA